MRKIFFCLVGLLIFWSGNALAWREYNIKDLRQFSTYRLGIVETGWDMDPGWLIDVWINGGVHGKPNFTLATTARSQEEWTVPQGCKVVSICAVVWIFDNGQKIVLARTASPVWTEVNPFRDSEGYGWRVVLESSDFGLSYTSDGSRFGGRLFHHYRRFFW